MPDAKNSEDSNINFKLPITKFLIIIPLSNIYNLKRRFQDP